MKRVLVTGANGQLGLALQDAAKAYSMGDDVDGLGGFVLESEDGTLSFDLRFDTLLEDAWADQRAAVNETLFG